VQLGFYKKNSDSQKSYYDA